MNNIELFEYVGLSVLTKLQSTSDQFFVKFDEVISQNLRVPLRLPNACSTVRLSQELSLYLPWWANENDLSEHEIKILKHLKDVRVIKCPRTF